MSARHTPGVWTLLPGRGAEVFDDEGEFIMSMNRPSEEVMANARLIAAAPDLLAALQASTHILHTVGHGEPCRCGQCNFVRLRDVATAKAIGATT